MKNGNLKKHQNKQMTKQPTHMHTYNYICAPFK